MADDQHLPSQVVFPAEVEHDRESFEKEPVLAIARFLECFDEGRQVLEVPRHVLEALAERFADFARDGGDCQNLDDAFGGKTPRQLNRVRLDDRNRQVLFGYENAYNEEVEIWAAKAAKGEAARGHGDGGPADRACDKVGAEHCIATETVRAILRGSGPRRKAKRPKWEVVVPSTLCDIGSTARRALLKRYKRGELDGTPKLRVLSRKLDGAPTDEQRLELIARYRGERRA